MSTGSVEDALGAVPGDARVVEVMGRGPLADRVRAELGDRAGTTADAPPDAVVETTGQPDGIRAALARVADLGTVVLAGPLPVEPVELDLYADVHLRGLTVVGVRRGDGEVE